jgi:hypothetical protein
MGGEQGKNVRRSFMRSVICSGLSISIAFFFSMAFFLLSGCSQRAFDGPIPEGTELSKLETRLVDVETIDGKSASLFASSIDLLPGLHTLEGNVAAAGYHSPAEKNVKRVITFETKPGRSYYVKGSSGYAGCIWVEDVETRKIVSWDKLGCGITPPKMSGEGGFDATTVIAN